MGIRPSTVRALATQGRAALRDAGGPMADLKEIFDMVTNKTEPDLDAWQQQERRQRRRAFGRRTAAFAVAAVVLAAAIVAVAALRDTPVNEPAASTPPPLVGTTALVAYTAVGRRGDTRVHRRRRGPSGRVAGWRQIAFLRTADGHRRSSSRRSTASARRAGHGLARATGMRVWVVRPDVGTRRDPARVLGDRPDGVTGRIYVLDIADGAVHPAPDRRDGQSFEMTPEWSSDG